MEPKELTSRLERFWKLSGEKILDIDRGYDTVKGSPVFTVEGRYTTRGWTEWTEGFVYGSAILQFDATGERAFLDLGRRRTVERMAKHVTHTGVHDHGFNNVSTFGNLLRLAREGRYEASDWEMRCYEMALKCSGAVQAARWTELPGGMGFIRSFNGPHSLFADTIRSLRSLAVAHRLGHVLMSENDTVVSLLDRLIRHARTTAEYIVYYGTGRDSYDVRGRTVHEAIFNVTDGKFRCPSTQQGYSPFSTWTRGLAWIITGYAEELEFIAALDGAELEPYGGREAIAGFMLEACTAAADFYLENSAADGIPYWDTGAPAIGKLGDYRSRPADPGNPYEPVDSSAAAIAVQGLMRLGHYLTSGGDPRGKVYMERGLEILGTLVAEPYLSVSPDHQGLLLHSVYHRPNGWDHAPDASGVPRGESSMWGDYHIREAALYVRRLIAGGPYYTFYT